MSRVRGSLSFIVGAVLAAALAWTPAALAGDGGEPCEGDINGDGIVNVQDLLEVVFNFGECPEDEPCPADLNGDGVVGPADLALLLGNWST